METENKAPLKTPPLSELKKDNQNSEDKVCDESEATELVEVLDSLPEEKRKIIVTDPDVLQAVADTMKDGLSFGAPTGRETELAKLVLSMVPDIEMVRMVNSGTEAVMSAIRVARGATGRDKIIKFEGCYHGHSDAMLVKAGSGALTGGQPNSAGVPAVVAADTLTAQYNDLDSVEQLLRSNEGAVAAVIVEPVAANMGVVPPAEGFLQGLRRLCDQYGALLIFDEVITGFRLAAGGAQEYFGVHADLVTFGKIIGGGMPVGAFAGSKKLMQQVAPVGPVYQAGTLSGNPVAMAAGIAQLTILKEHPEIYMQIENSAIWLASQLRALEEQYHKGCTVNQIGSLLSVFFTDRPVTDFAGANSSDTARYAAYFRGMLKQGIYLAPAQFEAMFVGAAHTRQDLMNTVLAASSVMQNL